MPDRNYRIKLRAPLTTLDSAEQTFGCRANNPDICANCYLEGVCAFVTEDHICHRPSRAWGKIYAELKQQEEGKNI